MDYIPGRDSQRYAEKVYDTNQLFSIILISRNITTFTFKYLISLRWWGIEYAIHLCDSSGETSTCNSSNPLTQVTVCCPVRGQYQFAVNKFLVWNYSFNKSDWNKYFFRTKAEHSLIWIMFLAGIFGGAFLKKKKCFEGEL